MLQLESHGYGPQPQSDDGEEEGGAVDGGPHCPTYHAGCERWVVTARVSADVSPKKTGITH